MSSYVNPIPTADSRSAARFRAWLERVSNKRVEQIIEKQRKEIISILTDILDDNPVYTGASKGIPGPHVAKTKYPSHPAYGMSIGNALNGGESGWQIGEKQVNQYRTSIYLWNPMWEPYLKYIEYNMVPTQTSPGGFVRKAWLKHLARRRRR